MEWSEERILQFLELYQKEELIWNPKHRHHKNRQKINDAWSRLSTIMGLPVSNLKLKKNSLMASFRAHLRKKKSSVKSGMGAEDAYEPIWFAFQLMEDFLAPVYDCGDTIDTEDNASSPSNKEQHVNDQQSASNQIENTENIEIIHHSEETDHHSTVHAQPTHHIDTSSDFPAPTSQRQRRRQLASEISDAQKKIKQTFETLNNVISQKKRDVEEDDCDLYGKLLGNKLRNYSKYERHLMMHEIDGLLLKKPPRRISNISCNSYSTSSPGHPDRSTDSLLQSPVHINIPNQSFSAASYVDLSSQSPIHRSPSAASSYDPILLQSPVPISIPNRPSSGANSIAPSQSQSPIHRPSSESSSYIPMPSQSPVQISIPSRPSSAYSSYAPFLSQSPIHRQSSAASSYTPMASQSPVQISIPNRTSSGATSYTYFQSQSPVQISIPNYQPMPSSVSTTQSNQIHILSEEVILPSINILQRALTNAEIDEFDVL